jgi:hypothetical protein
LRLFFIVLLERLLFRRVDCVFALKARLVGFGKMDEHLTNFGCRFFPRLKSRVDALFFILAILLLVTTLFGRIRFTVKLVRRLGRHWSILVLFGARFLDLGRNTTFASSYGSSIVRFHGGDIIIIIIFFFRDGNDDIGGSIILFVNGRVDNALDIDDLVNLLLDERNAIQCARELINLTLQGLVLRILFFEFGFELGHFFARRQWRSILFVGRFGGNCGNNDIVVRGSQERSASSSRHGWNDCCLMMFLLLLLLACLLATRRERDE